MAFCAGCGTAVEIGASFCPNCGKGTNVNATSGAQAAAARPAPMPERVFYDAGGVKVTTTRFMVPNQTYAMSGITSVTSIVELPSRKGPIIMILIGVLGVIMFGTFSSQQQPAVSLVFAAALIAIGVWLWTREKSTYHIVLKSASGEQRPISDKNHQFIDDVVQALNEAIVHKRLM
jgi:hypothetical protein